MLVSIINNCYNLKEIMTLTAACLKPGQGQKKRNKKNIYSWYCKVKNIANKNEKVFFQIHIIFVCKYALKFELSIINIKQVIYIMFV